MKHGQKIYKSGIYYVIGSIVCIAIMRTINGTFACKTVTCTIDPRIHQEVAKDIENHINGQTSNIAKTIASAYKTYPWIKSIHYNYITPYSVNFSIMAHDPYIRCNDTIYMTADGLLIPQSIYTKDFYTDLYTIHIPSCVCTTSISSSLCTFITSIPDAFFDRFTMHWHDEHLVLLSDKQKSTCTLLIDPDNPSFDTITTIADNIDTFMQKNIKNIHTTIDCRFAEQIIVYDAIRGNHDKGSV
ncbi:MAG TPA: hypothetical protein VGW78_01550 [Candidatus Babeliales bacterium]|nr:hypothetical protein [Candidatus Babeliales bacterium]